MSTPTGKPDWHVIIENGEPEMYINAAMIARMACNSPMGVAAAMDALDRVMTPEHFAKVEDELRVIANA